MILTEMQERFVEAYVGNPPPCGYPVPEGAFNATRAAAVAGYAWPGKQGPRLMTFAAVAERVEELFRERYPVS